MLNKYTHLIFDCDGVLTDTNERKSKLFEKVLSNYPQELVMDFIKYHKAYGGVSRYKKFEYFVHHILGEPDPEKVFYNHLLESYSREVIKVYEEAPLTISCEALLSKEKNKEKELYVASGSDETELRTVFKSKGISEYFTQIYGSPKTKEDCLEIILQGRNPNDFVMIGDSLSDYKAANHFDMDFIFMTRYSEQPKENVELCKKGALYVIDTLDDLLE